MFMRRAAVISAIGIALVGPFARTDEAKPPANTVEQIAESARKSVVVITQIGRDGIRHGLGTGFIVAADGLIATNLHVIGEARPISVQLANGKHYDVTAIHAFDRFLDLALVRIDAKDLKPLALGDSDSLKQGQSIVAIGNPHGLKNSVVAGVVSGRRELDGRSMIQLAIPIEPGNSGGPVLDMEGRVHGLITIKSLVTANLGFAMPINGLKTLLQKPNPVPIAKWLTIGVLDPAEWRATMGAHWRQRGGRLTVEGQGSGFGGRSLCLWQPPVPEMPYEVAVTVKLDDEAGAAGLAFHADGGDKHYGFYPTAGQLRLTRFDGPDVNSWTILKQLNNSHYHPGEWNTLKVRVEKDKFLCFVNEHLAIESSDRGLAGGKVGLAKFRDTRADFKNFQVGQRLAVAAVPEIVFKRITAAVAGLPLEGAPRQELVDALAPEGSVGIGVLRERAKRLEQEAAQLKQLARAVHEQRVLGELAKAISSKDADFDLFYAALLIAKLDNDELDVDAYRKQVDRMARELAADLPKDADDMARLTALNKYLFAERGFHGSRNDYYTKANSYLSDVLDDRKGLPITLSVLYMELGRRIGLKLEGVGLPGHFVVRLVPVKGESKLIDVFDGGTVLTKDDAGKKVQAITEDSLHEEDLKAISKKAILVRILHNLMGLARRDQDADALLRYLDAILVVTSDAGQERWMRALLRYQTGRRTAAVEDADWLLEHKPPRVELQQVEDFRRMLERP
jgi:serine protease Do